MLTRFVRIQLAIFAVFGTVAMAVLVFAYIQAPTLLGIGKMTVTLELPTSGALYRFGNVTYRGVQAGKVTSVKWTSHGVKATLALDPSPKIPADVQAEVHSMSAVGEQYVDLRPRSDSPPYLHDGSVIEMQNTSVPLPVGPMMDKTSALINSIPQGKLSALLDESFQAFNGSGYDFGSLFDSSARISHDLNGVSDRTQALTEGSGPLLDSQVKTTDAIRLWARSIGGFSDQLVTNDGEIRSLLERGPGALDESSRLLEQIKPTLPVLLANLTTIGQIGVTYHASLEQMLVLLPPYTAALQSFIGSKNPTGLATGVFTITLDDPPGCTVGFLPPNKWRSPADTTTIDTPDGLYCKLPQDSPIGVRGARNYPCMGHPGKRAPTVEICNSDKPFEPLAMRQHVFGAYPLDPNLLSQGVAPDDRLNFFRDKTFGPLDGTPLPPGAAPRGTPPTPPGGQPSLPANMSPQSGDLPPIAPQDVPDQPGPSGGATHAAPSSHGRNGSQPGPAVAVTHYDPESGRYVGPDGQIYRQSELVKSSTPKRWQDMLPT